MTRTGADGTKFHRLSGVTREYRDSSGRFRTESPLATGDAQSDQKFIMIRDPVGQALYILDTRRMVARRTSMPATAAKPAQEIYQARLAAPPRSENVTREKLGPQTMEGVYVEGFRFVRNFPAGVVGNDRAFVVNEERWVAPDMALAIYDKLSDPRSGETVMRRTKILRVEPDPALFQVPPTYTIVDASAAPK